MYCTRSYKREKNKLAFRIRPVLVSPPHFSFLRISSSLFIYSILFYSILFYLFTLLFSGVGSMPLFVCPPPFFLGGGGVEGEGEGEGRGEREKRGVCLCLPDRGTNWWVNLMWCDKESNRIKSNRIEARCDKYVCRSRPSRPALEGIFFLFFGFWLLASGITLSLSLSLRWDFLYQRLGCVEEGLVWLKVTNDEVFASSSSSKGGEGRGISFPGTNILLARLAWRVSWWCIHPRLTVAARGICAGGQDSNVDWLLFRFFFLVYIWNKVNFILSFGAVV